MPYSKNIELFYEAELFAHFGTFEYNLTKDAVICSNGVYAILERPIDVGPITSEILIDYLQNTSKDDILTQINNQLIRNTDFYIDFEILTPKGNNKYISLTASIKITNEAETTIKGVIQDITVTKQKEIVLQKIQKSFTNVLKSSLDIICTFNQEGNFEIVSSACEVILGYKANELIGQNYKFLIHGEDIDKTEAEILKVINGHYITNFENNLIHKNGNTVPIIWSAFWDPANSTMYCNAKNGSERQQQNNKLLNNELKLNSLLYNSNDIILIINAHGRIAYVSPSLNRITGYTESEVKSINPLTKISKTDLNHLISEYQKIEKINFGTTTIKPIKLLLADNSWIWAEFTFNNRYADPSIEGILVTLRNITETENLISELRLMESVVKYSNDSIVITEAEPIDTPGPRILFANKSFFKITGYAENEVIGKTPRILQGPKTDKLELQKLKTSLEKWQKHEFSIINYKKNGETFWVNMSVFPISDKNGWITNWIAIQRDITIQKNKEIDKNILDQISSFFSSTGDISDSIYKCLQTIVDKKGLISSEILLLSVSGTEYKQIVYDPKMPNFQFAELSKDQVNHDLDLTEIFSNEKTFIKRENSLIFSLYDNHIIKGLFIINFSAKLDSIDSFKQFSDTIIKEITRKQIEIELNNIFNSSLDLIITSNKYGIIVKSNSAALNILEYQPEEIVNKPYFSFIHPDDLEKTNNEAKKLLLGENILYFENRLITKRGNIKWLAWTFTPAENNSVVYGIGKDITEKKKLEETIINSNELSKVGSWEINLINGEVFWSDITREIREVDEKYEATLVGGIEMFKIGHDRDLIKQRIYECIHEGKPWDEVLILITAKNNQKWVRSIGRPQILNNKCIKIIGSIQDITKQKVFEHKLIEANNRFNYVAKATNDLIWEWDIINNRILRFGDAFFKSLGYYADDEINEWNQLIHFDDRKEVIFTKKGIIANKQQIFWEQQYRIRQADNSYAYVFDRAIIKRDQNGNPIKVIGTTQNITKLKQSEIELVELNHQLLNQTKELALSNRELENFAYITSHDLQEPLRMISSFLTQIEKKYGHQLDEKGKKYIFYAVDGAKRMRNIILDLLNFSRIGKQELFYEKVNINEIIQDILFDYKKIISNCKATIIFEDLPEIYTYKATIRQVFQNLISNAIKFRNSKFSPIIKIEYENNTNYWLFKVEDNGIGIEMKYSEKIFEIFSRLHNKESYEGTGIGLALVKKIIESQGGNIWLESHPDKGSKFYFTIKKEKIDS